MTTTLTAFFKRPGLALCAAIVGLAGLPAFAGGDFAPVARVNDRVVTAYELDQRISFLGILNAAGKVEEIALDQLIDERLQLDLAAQMGLSLSDEQLGEGMTEFAGRANLSSDEFIAALAQGGVAAQSFRDFITAGMLWREVVRQRLGPRVQISEAEIDRSIALTQPGAGVRVLLSEIILPADAPETKANSEQLAADLAEIDSFQSFALAAQNYSVSQSAARGGELDWMDLSNLPANIAAMILPLTPGHVAGPFPMRNAIGLFQMRAIAETGAPEPRDVSIDYAAYYSPGGRGPAALAEAASLRDRVDSCDDLYGINKGQPEARLTRDVSLVRALPADYAVELAKLDPGEVSTALVRGSDQSLVFLMLCGRTREMPEDVSREDIRRDLVNRRLSALAESYLEELRGDAFIEILIGQ